MTYINFRYLVKFKLFIFKIIEDTQSESDTLTDGCIELCADIP